MSAMGRKQAFGFGVGVSADPYPIGSAIDETIARLGRTHCRPDLIRKTVIHAKARRREGAKKLLVRAEMQRLAGAQGCGHFQSTSASPRLRVNNDRATRRFRLPTDLSPAFRAVVRQDECFIRNEATSRAH